MIFRLLFVKQKFLKSIKLYIQKRIENVFISLIIRNVSEGKHCFCFVTDPLCNKNIYDLFQFFVCSYYVSFKLKIPTGVIECYKFLS